MLLEEYSFGGEPSGHIIFRDFATTGDGQLTAIQLLCLLKREGISLEEAAKVMTHYPQVMINVKVSHEGKLKFYMDPEVKAAIEAAKAELDAHDGKVWTFIFSLRREDAERLGYNKAAAWRNLLKQESAAIAEAMRIRTDDFRWYAAYHDEGHHPHVHMLSLIHI